MDRNIIIVSTIAFASGAAVGFLAATKKLEKKYADLAQEEINSVKAQYGRLTRRTKVVQKMSGADFDGDILEEKDRIVGVVANEYETMKTRYDLMYKESPSKVMQQVVDDVDDYPGERDVFNEEEDDAEIDQEYNPDIMVLPGYDYEDPYVISIEQFEEECLDHDKLTITWYAEDNTLVDEQDEIIDDVEYTVGEANIDIRNARADHPHTVYVRNERISTDFEIDFNLNSYAEMVLGVAMTPREKYEKIQKRKRGLSDD